MSAIDCPDDEHGSVKPGDGMVAGPSQGGQSVAGSDVDEVSLLGHDIRSAMSDVLGGLRLLDVSVLPEAERIQVSRAKVAADTLARLLDIALLQAGEAALPDSATGGALNETALADLLLDAERRWAANAREHGMELRFEAGANIPQVIGLERTRLERVLSNMLSNAIKYGQTKVFLEVALNADQALCFTVYDDGPGFAPEIRARLSEGNVRAGENFRPGHGMGLQICRDLADSMGGSVIVNEGQPGGCLILTIPKEGWALNISEASIEPTPDLSDMSVLVVEDNPTSQTVVSQMLTRMGAEVTVAGNGLLALEHWRQSDFDLALIDIELPKLSGLEVIRELRATRGVAGRVPILAVTAYVLRSNRDAIFAVGADGVLAKPLSSFGAFASAVGGVLRRTGQRQKLTDSAPSPDKTRPPEGRPDPEALFDPDTLQHLLGIAGPQGEQELLSRLDQDLRATQRQLQDGLARKDVPVIRAKTHILISLAGAIGSRRLQTRAERMNDAAHARDHGTLDQLGPIALAELGDLIALLNEQYDTSAPGSSISEENADMIAVPKGAGELP